ncbi:two-component system OmpR family response regulator [Pseudomonas sp. W2I6]|nr:two-component system OmpR family response regulator [Pseudomonas sp. W2I6]
MLNATTSPPSFGPAANQVDDRTMQTLTPVLNDDQKASLVGEDKRWNTRALIVDDDVPIRELLIDYLARFNILASGVTDGAAMRQAMQAETFDVVVLDLMLPGEDGLSLCRWLRAESDIPILMLTARCEPTDRIIGLELGADDYMSKPFEPRELVARIQTILRRVRDDRTEQRANIRFDNWRLNSVLRQLVADDGLGGAAVQRRIPFAVGVYRAPAPGTEP